MEGPHPLSRRTLLASIGATAGIGVSSGTGGSTERGRRHDRPSLVAHRGFADVYPENTVAAMRGATSEGAAAIEIDVQPCASDTPVAFHDRRLDWKTDAEGLVTETDRETVLGAEVLDSGETVPTLEAAMDAVPPSVPVNVELKYPGRVDERTVTTAPVDRWLPLVERTLEIASDQRNGVLVSSFFEAALAATRASGPDVPLAYLFADSAERGLAVAERYDCEAVHPAKDLTDEALVRRAHEAGRDVNPYTVDTGPAANWLRALGVDGIIADYPTVLE